MCRTSGKLPGEQNERLAAGVSGAGGKGRMINALERVSRLLSRGKRNSRVHARAAAGSSTLPVSGFWPRGSSRSAVLRVYDDMRAYFPVVDAALRTLVRLVGEPSFGGPVSSSDEVTEWARTVPVGPVTRGLSEWVRYHADQMLHYGTGAGQVLLAASREEVAGIVPLDVRRLELRPGATPFDVRVFASPPLGLAREELDRRSVLLSVNDPRSDTAYGTSLLASLPFTAHVLSIVMNATGQVWRRMGAPPFHVSWQQPEGYQDPDGSRTEEHLALISESFRLAMEARDRGEIADWFSTGDVEVDVVGSAEQLAAIQEPYRALMEQIVGATGLPSWMLGMHWSSTERLSHQQASALVAHVEGIRRSLQPALERLLEIRAMATGRGARVTVEWPQVDLHDALERPRADYLRERARAQRIANGRLMWELGYWTQEQAARDADEAFVSVARPLDQPPGSVGVLPPASSGGDQSSGAETVA